MRCLHIYVSGQHCSNEALPNRSRCDEHNLMDGSHVHGVDCDQYHDCSQNRDLPEGKKYDAGKDPWDLMPWGPLAYVVLVLRFGTEIYGIDNWQKVDNWRRRYFAAAMRHLLAWFRGERLDPQSKLPHLAHAVTCLLFLIWKDDNPDAKS